MKKYTFIIAITFLMVSAAKLNAQDVLFTQFTDAPLVINPAFAGHFEGKYRLGAIYRNQWAAIVKSGMYSTPYAFAYFNLFYEKVRGSFGLGISFLNDESAGGKFNNLGANMSLAYHFAFDPEEQHNFLSFGIQGGMVNQRIRLSDFTFASQFNGEKIDPTIGSNESIANDNILTPDLSVGAVWASYFGTGSNIKIGGSYKHLLTQTPSFLNNQTAFLPSMLLGHAELNYQLSPFFSLHPRVMYAVQGKATQLNGQLMAGLHFSQTTTLYAGGGIRSGDALIAALRLQLDKINIGLAYDVNNNPLMQSATRGQGAWEISLQFMGGGAGAASKVGKATAVPKRYF